MNPTWTTFPVHRATKKAAVAWGALKPGQKIPIGPDQDVGVACGARTGIIVIDLDVKNGKRGPETFAALGPCPETLKIKTPSGGAHLYFEAPAGIEIPNSVEKLGSGIDVRGDGGYVVAPPSPGYTIAHRAPIAALPDWLLALIRKQERPATEPGTPVTKITTNRNITLTSMAGHMLRAGFGDEAVRAALHEANRTQCVPPLPDAEVEATLGQAAKWASRGAPKADKNGPTPGFEPLSLDRLVAPVPDPHWYVEALGVAPGRPTQLVGMGYLGKTIIAQALALATAAGLPVWGRFRGRRGPVGWLDYEMGPNPLLRRFRRLAIGLGRNWDELAPLVSFCSLPRTKLCSADLEDHLARFADGLTACFIDSLHRSLPGVEENSSEISEFIDRLLYVSEQTGCTFWFLHHSTTKTRYLEGQDQRGAGRGSSAIFDSSGTVLSLSGKLREPILVQQTRSGEGGLKVPDFELLVADDEATGGLVVTARDAEGIKEGLDEDIAKVVDAVRGENLKGQGVGIDAVRRLTKLAANDNRAACWQAVKRGVLENRGSEARPDFWAVVSVFPESDQEID